jgi:BolA protein
MGMSVKIRIEEKLKLALKPVSLTVIDESHLHMGHRGAPNNGESHFHIKIVAQGFEGKTTLQCHRMIYEILSDELKDSIHALSIVTNTPIKCKY